MALRFQQRRLLYATLYHVFVYLYFDPDTTLSLCVPCHTRFYPLYSMYYRYLFSSYPEAP